MSLETQFIRKAGSTPGTFDSLSTDITDIVLKRIVYLCLFCVGMATIGSLVCLIRSACDTGLAAKGIRFRVLEHGPDVLTILASVVVGWLVHRRKFSSRTLFTIGLGYGLYSALWFSYGELFMLVADKEIWISYFSFNAVWVVFFPAIIPIRLRTTFFFVLLVAAMPPLSRGLAQSLGWVELPGDSQVTLSLLMIFSSIMGLYVSHVVYKLGKTVKEAREMGSYTLEERLGEGGMGVVWKARHRLLARPAAVKLIKPEVFVGMNPDEVSRLNHRFEHEVQATAALYSPHTVDIYDYGVDSTGTFFYVMELLDGIDMETMVERFGPVEPSRVAHFLIQACHSLSEANNRQMVHRDIKPANLFVCKFGDDHDFVKVLDFGLVKREDLQDRDRQKLTAEGRVNGTPAYMSPESISGEGPVDHRSDLYSLGCVAYWLLTGQLLFTAKTPMAVLIKHLDSEPVPPSQLCEMEIPEEFENLILACLAKDPEDRPQTAAELAGLLRKINFQEPWEDERARAWWELHLDRSQ